MIKFYLLITLALLSACQTMTPVEIKSTFNANEYSDYLKTGKSTITGQAFLKQKGGGVVTCAGTEVILFPDTSYFREMVEIAKSRRKPTAGDNAEEVKKLARKTICDANGNFEFNEIAAADWIILSEVQWRVSGVRQGGWLIKHIKTEDKALKVMLVEENRI